MSVRANRELGPRQTMGPRDEAGLRDRLSPLGGRLVRALDNHFEALILFTLAVVVVTPRGPAHRPHRRLRLGLSRRARPLRPGLCLRLDPLALGDLAVRASARRC